MESQRATVNELTFEIDNLKWQSHCQSNFIITTLLLLKVREPLSEQLYYSTQLLGVSLGRQVCCICLQQTLHMAATDSHMGSIESICVAATDSTYGCNRFSISFDSITKSDSWASGLLYMATTDSNMDAIECICVAATDFTYGCNRLLLLCFCMHMCMMYPIARLWGGYD